MISRRQFLQGSATLIGAHAISPAAQADLPPPSMAPAGMQRPPLAMLGVRPVTTLNGWSLPFRLRDGAREFHLVAQPVAQEIAPGMKAKLWGYNGRSPGPTLEMIEGERVRIFVTNQLPEPTTVHWHGMPVPNGMDGVAGVTQAAIAPGDTWQYEFMARRSGSFMYHPHADDMMQMAMGMMGCIVVHPKDARTMRVDRDYAFVINAYDIQPGTLVPRVGTMTDFNTWTWNSRVFPGIETLFALRGERVRIRIGNLSMDSHPIHLHGHSFEVTGTDGGWVPKSARWPEVTVDVAPGQMRVIEFIAEEAGDWALHCHKSHHAMNAMGHGVPTMLGTDAGEAHATLRSMVPGYMPMGTNGMHEMASMRMPMPDNTLPMMSGQGPYGPIGMGGMFTLLKVRDRAVQGPLENDWYDGAARARKV
ncbi:copper oxidase [Noviherbaspirillum sp. L7-7A]|uniref:multicopper oxidase family protein n=1 Tax=Noviherbaspirillum sp. L7-7A TaxID=2850560 RepID=UPI001C2B7805|nr:copper oxidase [Noviherbaspirillum sp. L7-7A]MBV0881279.1 copper oxidase [Noviherbaspirillum sp. L7-7A]